MSYRILSLFALLTILYTQSSSAQSISYSSLFDNSSFSRSIDLSKPVGAIAGAAGTSPSGAATYTIPISCPPGTNGLAPQIALVYNSQSGNGILGQGWSLSGLSVITRVGKDFYHDGKAAPASYTNDDAFVLDGQRLVPLSGSNGAPGTTYGTEAESYSVTTSYSNIGSDPHYFSVRAKDGSIMEYGFSDDSRITSDDGSKIMVWRLNKLQDANGNYIWFTYDNSDRESRLVKIEYTGNLAAGISPYNEINIQYAPRTDINISYDKETYFNSKSLIRQIQVKEKDADVFKTWQFYYGKNNIGVSYLKMVEEFADNDYNKLNDTRFKYGDENSVTVNEVSNSDADISNTENDVYSGDFNGDGFSDLLVGTRTVDPEENLPFTTGFKIKIFNPTSGTYSTTENIGLSGGLGFIDKIAYEKNVYSLAPTDVNGDGIEDILLARTYSIPFAGSVKKIFDKVSVYYMNTSGNIASTEHFSPPSGFNIINPRYNHFFTGDFDGDGRTDFITVLGEVGGYEAFFTSPSTGVSNKKIDVPGSPYTYKGSPIFFNAERVAVINMDGDGKADLLVVDDKDKPGATTNIYTLNFNAGTVSLQTIKSGIGYPVAWHDIYFGDFNGDGKTDILTCPNPPNTATYWELAYSDGKIFRWETTLSTDHNIKQNFYYGSSSTDNIIVGDFNGDGKSDIYDYYNNGSSSQHRIYYSLGRSFTLKSQSTSRFWGRLAPGDYNGDGKVDLLNYHGLALAQFNFFQPNSISHLLEKVTDGFNRTTEFIYDPLTKGGDIYTKGSGETYPVNNAQYPVYVVTSVKTPDGVGGISNTALRYENLRVHRAGRGLLGFEKIRSINITAGFETQTQYALNRDFYVPYLERTKSFPSIDPSKYTQTIDNHLFTRIGSGYCYTQTNPSGSSEDQLTGSTGTYSNTYDTYGNITYSTSSALIGGGETMLTNVTNTMMITGGSPIPNRPQYVVTETKRGSKPTVSVQEYFEYDSKGRVSRHQVRKLPLTTTGTFITDYNYNLAGNLTWKRESTSSGDAPTYWPLTQYEYDSKGRFAEKEINTLGDFTSRTLHKFWGTPLTETGLDGLVRSYTYDAWGKRTAQTIPVTPVSSYTVTYSDAWDISGTQLYYALSTDPSAPDTKIWYDIAGRAIRTMSEGFSGWTTALQSYNNKGQLVSSTNNYLPSETPRTSINTYDALNRLSSVSDFSGTTTYDYSYSSGATTVTVNGPSGIQKKTETDALGKVLRSMPDPVSGTVHYTYDSRGKETQTRVGTWTGTVLMGLIRKEYDPSGRLTKMIDPDAGTSTYEYDAFGRMLKQTDPLGKVTQYTYDQLGRLVLKELEGYKTTYEFWDKTKAYALKKQDLEYPTGLIHVTDEYEYGVGGGLVTKHTRSALGHLFEKKFTYTAYGQPSSTEYVNSGFKKQHHYDNNGYLLRIKTLMSGGVGEKTLYEATTMNGDGQLKSWKRADGQPATISYNNGFVAGLSTGGIQNLAMSYDYARGNVWGRADLIARTTEEFNYDPANRLIYARAEKLPVGGSPGMSHMPLTMEYENNFWGSYGRLKSKSDVGNYVYHGSPRNAVASIQDPAGLASHETQDIIYRPFHKAGVITETIGGVPFREVLDYDADDNRVRSEHSEGGAAKQLRWYFDDFELTENLVTGSVQSLHYISGDAGLCGIVKEEGGSLNYYSVYTDHLGSIVTVTDEWAGIVAWQSYDPWGRERNPEDWGYGAPLTGPSKPSWLYRGYTGHEMLPEYGLINMNGRMYDPLNGRMLRPDNYVQDPANSQSYNRYSYCWNNPVTYTDPSGDIIWAPIIIGAMIGGFSGWQMAEAKGATGWSAVGYIAGGAAIGAASGLAAAGVSSLGASAFVAGATGGAVSGAGFAGLQSNFNGAQMLKGAGISALSSGLGGTFGGGIGGGWGAFASGSISSLISSILTGGLEPEQIAMNTVMGGVISFGMYHASSAIAYNFEGGKKWGEINVSYRQYLGMQKDYQMSRFNRKEYGGHLMPDGSYRRFQGEKLAYEIKGQNSIIVGDDVVPYFHTHWDRPNKSVLTTKSGYEVFDTYKGEGNIMKTTRYFSPIDKPLPGPALMLNRFDGAYSPGGNLSGAINPMVLRFIPSVNFRW